MFKALCWRVAGRSLALAGLGLAALGPAQADYVSGTWDPPFGAPFATNLGWRGSILASIPSDCSELPVGIRPIALPNCSTPWTTVNAQVEFYDTTAPAVTLETLNFTSTVSIDEINVGLDISLQAVINGLGSADPSTAAVVTSGAALNSFGVASGTSWALAFDIVAGQTVASLYWTSDTQQCFNGPFCFEGRNSLNSPANVTVKELPEPAPLALALLGLGAMLRRARRR